MKSSVFGFFWRYAGNIAWRGLDGIIVLAIIAFHLCINYSPTSSFGGGIDANREDWETSRCEDTWSRSHKEVVRQFIWGNPRRFSWAYGVSWPLESHMTTFPGNRGSNPPSPKGEEGGRGVGWLQKMRRTLLHPSRPTRARSRLRCAVLVENIYLSSVKRNLSHMLLLSSKRQSKMTSHTPGRRIE